MSSTHTPKHSPLSQAKLEWRNETTPVASDYGDVYFSAADGAAESRYVFLEHNQLAQRFDALFNDKDKSHFIIAETGFGTGLNFLQTLKLWQDVKNNSPNKQALHKHLYFISTEIHPLTKPDLKKSLSCWPELKNQVNQLLNLYPHAISGIHTLEFSDGCSLLLCQQDVITGLQQLNEHDFPALKNTLGRCVDAWFLDGFAPSKNPDMWSDTLFQTMASLSHRGTTLATFTASGFVRRGLKAAGFSMQKTKGFGRKREMLIGQYRGLPYQTQAIKNHLSKNAYSAFWPVYQNRDAAKNGRQKTAIVIGAGIAGCTTAKQLADAGVNVTLVDSEEQMMQKASGNKQGVLFPKLSHQQGDLAEFNLHSYLYAQRLYHPLDAAFHKSGMLQVIENNKLADAEALIQRFQNMPNLVTLVDQQQASTMAGTTIKQPCLWYASTGWFRQASLQQRYEQQFKKHVDVNFMPRTEAVKLQYQHDAEKPWTVMLKSLKHNSSQLMQADFVIICNAFAANSLLKTLDNDDFQLPLKNIRGQISQINNDQLPQLKTTLCHNGYITPADPESPNTYNLGASYDLRDTNAELSKQSQQQNLQKLIQYLPDFSTIDTQAQSLSGSVAFRCTTPDYLPVVGPVPMKAAFKYRYKNYAKTAKAFIPVTGPYYSGLMLNTGFGSRGFATAPLTAAIIKAYCLQQPFPVNRHLLSAINPARFLVRDIIRRKS